MREEPCATFVAGGEDLQRVAAKFPRGFERVQVAAAIEVWIRCGGCRPSKSAPEARVPVQAILVFRVELRV